MLDNSRNYIVRHMGHRAACNNEQTLKALSDIKDPDMTKLM